MTAAERQQAIAKDAAVLRSLADMVASPVMAGKNMKGKLSHKRRVQWDGIIDRVAVDPSLYTIDEASQARMWRDECKAVGIGAGLFGWLLWNWALPMLIELAKLWIDSRSRQHD